MSDRIEPLEASERPNPEAPNRIVITFRDEHTIDGAKIDVAGVTSLQIVVAVYHLMRTANAMDDAALMRAARERMETDAILADLNAGKGLALPGRRNGRTD